VASEVLIVEDDRELARLCARALEGQGYAVRQVHDGITALQAVETHAPDLILLDLLLPKKDGRAVLTALTSLERTAEIPVVVMSGIFKGRDVAREFDGVSGRGFLEKPFSVSDLLGEVHALIGTAEPEQTGGLGRAQLTDVLISDFLWRTMGEGNSGAIQLQRGKLHKVLVLDRGRPRAIRSNATSETFGRFLLDRGRIDRAAYEESKRRTKAGEQLQGQALVEIGALTRQQLSTELHTHAAAKFLEIFSWTEGEAWFEPDVTRVSFTTPLEGWTARLAILRGVKQMTQERLIGALGPFVGCPVERTELVLEEREQRVPAVAAVLEQIRTPRAVRDMMAEHAAGLYGLWLVGAVRLPLRKLDTPPARTTGTKPAVMSKRGAQLQRTLDELGSQSYFEVLGVSESVETREIQASYTKLAKLYHPDRHAAESDDAKRVAAEIFALLTLARDTLSDASRRSAYQRQLAGEPDTDTARVDHVIRAEKLFRDGEALLKKKEYAAALQKFTAARDLDANEGEFHVLYGWTYFVVNRQAPGAERAGIEALERGISLAPESPKGYYYLAQLYQAVGQQDQARKFLRKVLSIEPEHAEAQAALRLIKLRQDKERATGGLFGLGKKKG
jgi:DNA-binding response OmpR family regulator/tetratricopeptide (TPR) repeat protein